jgi:hypothetical protein
MTKKLFQVLLVLFVTGAFAQSQIKGVIKDIVTNEAISHVTISSADEKHVTISNEEGSFSLSLPAGVQKFTISSLGYNSYDFNAQNLPADGVYYIEPKELVLDEVVMMNTPINEYLKSLIASSQAKLNAPAVLNTYYREFVKINQNYTKFADGLVDYSVLRDKKKLKTQIQVKQSRAEKLESEEDEALDAVTALDVRKAVLKDYGFNGVYNIFLKDDGYKDYDFLIKTQKDAAGNEQEVITFTPKDGLKKELYQGKIVYDPAGKLIMNVNLSLIPAMAEYTKVHNFLILKAQLDDVTYNSGFKIVDGKYMLSFSSRDGSIHIWNKKRFNDVVNFKSDLVVTGFSANVPDLARNDKYKERSLYENGNSYTEKFWQKNNSIVMTAQEEQIVKSLENKQ